MTFDISNVFVTIVTGIATCAFGAFMANRLSLAKSDREDRRAGIDEAADCLSEIRSLTDEYSSRCITIIDRRESGIAPVSNEFTKEQYKFLSDTRLAVKSKTSRLIFLAESYIGFTAFYWCEVLTSLQSWNEIGLRFEDTILHGEGDQSIDHKIEIEGSREAFSLDLIPLEHLIRDNYRKPPSSQLSKKWIRDEEIIDFVGPLTLQRDQNPLTRLKNRIFKNI